jgi:hypothetical protein
VPFTPNHLTIERVEEIYSEVLCAIEERELRGWLHRIIDPAAVPELAAITQAREALEVDLAASRLRWMAGAVEKPAEG